MADRNDKWADNVGGGSEINGRRVSFYVDRECILCSVCSDAAPHNFRMSDDEDHDICFKQPETEKELRQCWEAMENCPVEAIGDDG
jgi:ferredoxin